MRAIFPLVTDGYRSDEAVHKNVKSIPPSWAESVSAFGPIISEIVEVIRELSADPIGKKVINQLINSIIEFIGQNALSSVKKN